MQYTQKSNVYRVMLTSAKEGYPGPSPSKKLTNGVGVLNTEVSYCNCELYLMVRNTTAWQYVLVQSTCKFKNITVWQTWHVELWHIGKWGLSGDEEERGLL